MAKEDFISLGESIIIKEVEEKRGLYFEEIKDMEVIDLNGKIRGTVEDLIIDSENYDIRGIIVSSWLIDKMIKGKQIFLLNDFILGEEYILYRKEENILFKIMPNNMKNWYV